MHLSRRLLPLVALAVLSCSESVAVDTPRELTMVIQTGGTPVTLPVATPVPITPSVRVTDDAGVPVAAVKVLFVATKGHGIVNNELVLTNADGIASISSWIYGQLAGPQELTAAVVDATSDARVTFTGTALPASGANLIVTPASMSLLPGATRQLRVDETDQYGNTTSADVAATFTSANPAVATVSNTGLVTAVTFGATTVFATWNGRTVGAYVGVGTRPTGNNVVNTPVASRPYGVAFSPPGVFFVTRVDASELSRGALPSTAIAPSTTMVSPAYDLVFLPAGNVLYVVNTPAGRVSVVDPTTNNVLRSFLITGEPFRIEAAPDGQYVFVSTSGGQVHRINTTTDAAQTVSPGGTINGLTVNPARGVLYASTTEGLLHEISLATFTNTRTMTIGGTLQGMAVTSDGNTLFIADEGGGVKVLDATTLAVQATALGTSGAFDVALTTDGVELYVSRTNAGVVTVLNAQTLTTLRSYTGGAPRRFGVSLDGTTVAVANESGWVTIIR